MRIFALETNISTLRSTYLNSGETLVLTTFRSFFYFLFRVPFPLLLAAALAFFYLQAPLLGNVAAIAQDIIIIVGVIGVGYPLFITFIQWRYTFIDVLDDQIVVVFQYSLFRRDIIQINLEEFANQRILSQFFNIFPFGILFIELRGEKPALRMSFVPDVLKVADTISDVVSKFQSK